MLHFSAGQYLSARLRSLLRTPVFAAAAILCVGQMTEVRAAAISVRITPTRALISTGQSLQLSAAVSGTDNQGVTWSLSVPVGTISATGLFTAPTILNLPTLVIVTATSVADGSKKASSLVIVDPPVTVSVSPGGAVLGASQTQQFAATVTGSSNPGVTWTISPAVGSISATGLYMAPAAIASPQTVTVTARSQADTSKLATAAVTLNPAVTISVSPGAASLGASQTQQFTAAVGGSANTAVTWTISPAVGSISGSGLYTAPATIASQQTVTVTARSQADTSKTAVAVVTLNPAVTISVSPGAASLGASQTQQFTAAVGGSANTAVTWTISPAVGSISATGLYTAPAAIASQQTVTVTARSQADTSKTAVAAVTLNPTVTISVSPGAASLGASQTQQFAAAVGGSANTAVTWTISPAVGSISATGLYTAPAAIASQQTVTVTARSQADTSKTAVAAVTLNPTVTISVSPGAASLGASQTQQFAAAVGGSANTAVTWTISPAVGSISATGLYTAPAAIASQQTVTVTARSQADTSKTAVAAVTLNPAVTISVSPGAASLGASQTQQFTAAVGGSSNTAVTWTISPAVGSISGSGLYTAPAAIASQQIVTVTARSQADTSKAASSAVTLNPAVTISVSPGAASLGASQTQQFTAAVGGSANTAVTWTISPAVGSISGSGLYTAPAAIASQQTVTVTARSQADTSKTATAAVTLNPADNTTVSVSPGNATLLQGGQVQFTATVTGNSNTAVTWSLNPVLGSISASGLYTAPASVSGNVTTVVQATSVASPSRSGLANVSIWPPAAVSILSPASGASVSGVVTITASATGGSGGIAGVRFQANGANIGAEDTGAPFSTAWDTASLASGSYTLTAIARDTQNNTMQSSVTVNVASAASGIRLPVEVMGANGTVVPLQFNLPAATNVAVPTTLKIRIHNLKYETQASVRINQRNWIPLNTATVVLEGNAVRFGGIGGGLNTLSLAVPIPAATLVTGTNGIEFRFDQTNGVVSGYRVLRFNIVNGSGQELIAAAGFSEDDPAAWQPILPGASDIQAGRTLWQTASITVPNRGAIRAKCADCHTWDGRDLKYFNYSNHAIRTRAMFHGLSSAQADQIASYIRSLATPAPAHARPWNPPYQPGSGVDARPVSEWAAGAGIDAVQLNDQATLSAVAPTGTSADYNWQGNLAMRNVPIAFSLPDWNQWLPQVHPVDSVGDAFLSHGYYTQYVKLRNQLRVGDIVALRNQKYEWEAWATARNNFYSSTMRVLPTWTAQQAAERYSAGLWEAVKLWELHQEFNLEGLSQAYYGSKAEPRGWYTTRIFQISPRLMNVPSPQAGIANGTQIAGDTLGAGWYHLQLLLNHGNGWQADNNPIDWPYLQASFKGLTDLTKIPMPGLQLLYLIKGMQVMEINGKGITQGWNLWAGDATRMATVEWYLPNWAPMNAATRQLLYNGYLTSWYQKIRTFTPSQMIAAGWVDAGQTQQPQNNQFANSLWWTLPQFRHLGVDQSVINGLADWAESIWPAGNWEATKTATCSTWSNGYVQCSYH